MKPRVPLYGCSPRGVGTPMVESLTGFVGRLAVARQLPSSAIFERLVRPLVPEGVLPDRWRLSNFLASGAVACDGHGPSAEALVRALTGLTGLRGLASLTLIPWRGFLATRNGAVRRGRPKRWCCACLAAWRLDGEEFWEPLLWRVSLVRRCPVHRNPLSELCSRCHARQGVVSEIVPFGSCRKCGRNLEADDPLHSDRSAGGLLDRQARWEWWTSVAVGRMLASQRLLARSGSPLGFSELLRVSLGSDPSVKRSSRRLAQYLDVGWNSIEVWMHRKRRPRLDGFLAVCMRLRVDPLQIAVVPSPIPAPGGRLPWSDASPPWPSLRASRPVRGRPRARRGPDRLRRLALALHSVLRDPGSARLSVSAVIRSLHTSRLTLMSHFPDEYARIVARHQAYRAQARDEIFEMRRDDLREAVAVCVSEGTYPSKQRVFEGAGLSAVFQRVPEYVQVWRDTLREHGIQRA